MTESRVEGFVVAKGGYCNARMVRWQDTRVIRRQGKGERGRGRTKRYLTMKSATSECGAQRMKDYVLLSVSKSQVRAIEER